MSELLQSGTSEFNIEVPYRLFESGSTQGKKPLIIYLHGFNQNISYFEKKTASMIGLEAYHLFIQAPYPIYDTSRKKSLSRWGRAWYLYDGDQDQFIRSMESASGFIQEVIDSVCKGIEISRKCMLGYSMGGYLAGFFALSRPDYIDDLIVIGGRIKTEAFDDLEQHAERLNILALHGKNDTSVYPDPQKECIDILKYKGFNASFKLLEEQHKLTDAFIIESKNWLVESGYVES